LVEQTEDPKVCASVYFRELFLEFSTNPIRWSLPTRAQIWIILSLTLSTKSMLHTWSEVFCWFRLTTWSTFWSACQIASVNVTNWNWPFEFLSFCSSKTFYEIFGLSSFFRTNLNQLAGQKDLLPMMKALQDILPTTVKNTKVIFQLM
jgi:hypothetical protein